MLNKLRCHANFQFSANRITWSTLLLQIHILNGKQCRSRSVGFFRSQLIWIYTFRKRVYPGSAGLGLMCLKTVGWMSSIEKPRSDAALRSILFFRFPCLFSWKTKKNIMILLSTESTCRGRQHSFVEIDHEIFSTVILSLPLIQEGQLSVSGERMCTILVNHLED